MLGVVFVSLVTGSAATFYLTEVYPEAKLALLGKGLNGTAPRIGSLPVTASLPPASPPIQSQATGSIELDQIPAESGLTSRMDKLEASQDRTNRSARMVIAVVALEGAARSGQPFFAQFQQVAPYLPEGLDRDTLGRLSQTGVPTSASLGKSLHDLSNRAIMAAEAPPESASLPVKIQHWLSSLVVLRRDDQTDPGSPRSDAVRLAEQLALDGDIAAAQAVIDRLPMRARELLTHWSAKAATRIQLDHALETLRSRALADLTNTGEVIAR
jgi:hypothetical protein